MHQFNISLSNSISSKASRRQQHSNRPNNRNPSLHNNRNQSHLVAFFPGGVGHIPSEAEPGKVGCCGGVVGHAIRGEQLEASPHYYGV
jgi:hypothetical protein